MTELLRAGMINLKDGSAGGHPAAAGGMISTKRFRKIQTKI